MGRAAHFVHQREHSELDVARAGDMAACLPLAAASATGRADVQWVWQQWFPRARAVATPCGELNAITRDVAYTVRATLESLMCWSESHLQTQYLSSPKEKTRYATYTTY